MVIICLLTQIVMYSDYSRRIQRIIGVSCSNYNQENIWKFEHDICIAILVRQSRQLLTGT